MKLAIIQTGGKQYIVKEGDVITVDRVPFEKDQEVTLTTLATFTNEGDFSLKTTDIKAKVIDNAKADKIRVAKFKAKVRYRKVKGYRHAVSRLQILSI